MGHLAMISTTAAPNAILRAFVRPRRMVGLRSGYRRNDTLKSHSDEEEYMKALIAALSLATTIRLSTGSVDAIWLFSTVGG